MPLTHGFSPDATKNWLEISDPQTGHSLVLNLKCKLHTIVDFYGDLVVKRLACRPRSNPSAISAPHFTLPAPAVAEAVTDSPVDEDPPTDLDPVAIVRDKRLTSAMARVLIHIVGLVEEGRPVTYHPGEIAGELGMPVNVVDTAIGQLIDESIIRPETRHTQRQIVTRRAKAFRRRRDTREIIVNALDPKGEVA